MPIIAPARAGLSRAFPAVGARGADRRDGPQRRARWSSAWQRRRGPQGLHVPPVDRRRTTCRRQAGHRAARGDVSPGKPVIDLAACCGPQGSHVPPVDRRRATCSAGKPVIVPPVVTCRRASRLSTWQRVEGLPRGGPRGADDRRRQGQRRQAGHRPGSVPRSPGLARAARRSSPGNLQSPASWSSCRPW